MSPAPTNAAGDWPRRVLDILALVVALLVAVAFAQDVAALVRYPWDWAPDEGLSLDYARRLLQAPETLYGRTTVPFPAAYTPLLPALLAPIVRASDTPLSYARVLAAAWTVGIAAATYLLVRRRARPPLALLAAALILAPRNMSFWYLLVRVDGLMIALWLLAAVFLLPDRLRRGADELTRGRLAAGSLLLLAAVLTKPTAVLHGAPLVLGWLAVDRRSAFRIAAAVGGGGLVVLGLLQWATDGGFLWVMGLWGVHPTQPGLLLRLVGMFLVPNLGYLLYLLGACLVAGRLRPPPERDGAWLLVLGALLLVPGLRKAGAWWNYLLPAIPAVVIVAGRLFGEVERARVPGRFQLASASGVILGAALATGSLLGRSAPLPSAADEATARDFYRVVRDQGPPILATRPDYAYFLVGQPVEAEGSGFPYLVAARVPGTDTLLERIRRREYRLVVVLSYFWPDDVDFQQALVREYEIAGICTLGYFYGRSDFVLMFPRGSGRRFEPTAGTRCRAVASPS